MDGESTSASDLKCALLLHDVNNLLAAALLLLDDGAWADLPAATRMAHARESVGRAAAHVALALDRSVGDGLADGACIALAVRLAAHGVPGARVRLHTLPPLPQLTVPCVALERALVNVVRNALIAAGPGGRVEVRVQPRGEEVHIQVSDDGPGLSAPPRQLGRGLGLLSSRESLEPHGGSVELHPRPEGGTEAVLRVPCEPD